MLFDGKVPDVAEGARIRQAESLTERFLRYYHHAVPFDRRVVEAAWRRCRGEDCMDRQRLAWLQLSSLDTDTPDLSDSAAPSTRDLPPLNWEDSEGENEFETQEIP